MVLEMLQEMTREEKEYTPIDGPAVTSMILIDRGNCEIRLVRVMDT